MRAAKLQSLKTKIQEQSTGRFLSKSTRHKNVATAIVILVVVFAFVSWYFYSYPSGTTTSTVVSTSILSTGLTPNDFSLSNSNGCEFVNNATRQIELSFNLYLTNRFNMPVHFANQSVSVDLGVRVNGQDIVDVLSSYVSQESPNFTDRLIWNLTFPAKFIPTNSTLSFLSVTAVAHAQEVSGVIVEVSTIPLPFGHMYPACST
jgi:hypothetical protein